MSRDFETLYYEQQASFTESNGMLTQEVRHAEAKLAAMEEAIDIILKSVPEEHRCQIVLYDKPATLRSLALTVAHLVAQVRPEIRNETGEPK
jgi:hypothetical protein